MQWSGTLYIGDNQKITRYGVHTEQQGLATVFEIPGSTSSVLLQQSGTPINH